VSIRPRRSGAAKRMQVSRDSAQVLSRGFAMGESPRWHGERLWLCDWGAQKIVALKEDGSLETEIAGDFGLPFCIDWLRDGRLLVVAAGKNALLRQEPDGAFALHADLAAVSTQGWNEIVVDGRDNIYVNGGPGVIALVTPGGGARQVADGIEFPNGMAVTPDNSTLIIAESHGKRLTAFTIADDGSLPNRRVWAALNGDPDGICIDADGAVWYADVPNKCCVRVREGGAVLARVNLELGCFACMLGGRERRTLFLVANEWRGMGNIAAVAAEKTGQVLCIGAPASHAGWP
jgi:sugar lactone lactonase YvrE